MIGNQKDFIESSDDSSSSDDDMIGPSIPKSILSAQEEEAKAKKRLQKNSKSNVHGMPHSTSRPEWMTLPPSWANPGTATKQIDPPYIKSRFFMTKKTAQRVQKQTGASSSWLESETDRTKREAEEMMGLRNIKNSSESDNHTKSSKGNTKHTHRSTKNANTISISIQKNTSKVTKPKKEQSATFNREELMSTRSERKKQILQRTANIMSKFEGSENL